MSLAKINADIEGAAASDDSYPGMKMPKFLESVEFRAKHGLLVLGDIRALDFPEEYCSL